MTDQREVKPANPLPCSACPWRRENQGKRHPGGWYSLKNLKRLWSGLRRGVAMSCHPTDPRNPVPEGMPTPNVGDATHECTGALILQQRELMLAQENFHSDTREYRKARPFGMPRAGFAQLVARALFGGTIALPGQAMARPNLNERSVFYTVLGEWKAPK